MLKKISNNHLLLLILLSAIWGSAFLAIKVSIENYNPITVASLRLIFGAFFLYLYLKYKNVKFDFINFRFLLIIIIIGIIGNFIPFFLISWSETYIQSNTAGLLLSVAPIFTLLLSHFFTKDDRFSVRKLISIVVGFVGVLLIFEIDTFNPSSENFDHFIPKLAIIISGLGYVISAILAYNIMKSFNILFLTTIVTISAAIFSLPFFVYYELTNPSIFSLKTILPIIYLGLFPTAIAFLLRFHIISKAGPTYLSYVAYLIPIFAIFWGYIFLGEKISLNTFYGVVLILVGVFISQKINVKKS